MMIKLIIMFFGQNTAEDVLCQYQNGDKMAAVRQMRINFPQAGASGIGSFELQTPGRVCLLFVLSIKKASFF